MVLIEVIICSTRSDVGLDDMRFTCFLDDAAGEERSEDDGRGSMSHTSSFVT